MNYYLDTSALVKAYVQEHRSAEVLSLVQKTRSAHSTDRVFVSRLAYAEAASAIARRQREGSLSASDARGVYQDLEADFTGPGQPYGIIEPTPAVISDAVRLLQRHPLRGFDAVHLATALLIDRATPGLLTLVAADRRLIQAAQTEGIPVLDLR